MTLVLASGSSARRAILAATGIAFDVRTADIDERAVEAPLVTRSAAPAAVAAALAAAKAMAVSRAIPEAHVIGADQTLDCDGVLWHKPASRTEARDQLAVLSGRTHRLTSALAVARKGTIVWQHTEAAHMTLRPLTAEEIGAYVAAAGDAALGSVGAYQIEGPGIRLFERIDGDYFTILGLPLLPLLAYLRGEGVIGW